MPRTSYFYYISSDLLKNRIFGSIQNESTNKRMLHALEHKHLDAAVLLPRSLAEHVR